MTCVLGAIGAGVELILPWCWGGDVDLTASDDVFYLDS